MAGCPVSGSLDCLFDFLITYKHCRCVVLILFTHGIPYERLASSNAKDRLFIVELYHVQHTDVQRVWLLQCKMSAAASTVALVSSVAEGASFGLAVFAIIGVVVYDLTVSLGRGLDDVRKAQDGLRDDVRKAQDGLREEVRELKVELNAKFDKLIDTQYDKRLERVEDAMVKGKAPGWRLWW
jgi:hypothetical protein